jgi:hypothetical protein
MAVLLCACGRTDRPPAGATSQPAIADARRTVADSLAGTGPNGLEIWFTLSRSAQSPAGDSCIERGLEIRRAGRRIHVPLLYTREPPIVLDDSTMRAVLSTNCRAVDRYRVDLRSGQPVRLQGAGTRP